MWFPLLALLAAAGSQRLVEAAPACGSRVDDDLMLQLSVSSSASEDPVELQQAPEDAPGGEDPEDALDGENPDDAPMVLSPEDLKTSNTNESSIAHKYADVGALEDVPEGEELQDAPGGEDPEDALDGEDPDDAPMVDSP